MKGNGEANEDYPAGPERVFHMFIRVLSGFTGTAILLLFFNYIFIEGKGIPVERGYYGLIIFPLGLFFAIAFIAYAFGGQKLLRKIAPGLAGREQRPNGK